ncbi:hypothetical protein CHLNCDRAFT_141422 [Chlorella variabilis]|uniref:C2H2-type domain-containing protein n=1 Tax=Chlorella variabilis TaxID=554065 RepID=E1ZSU5_CHLVA|nr:hypothetical protein CHLNCDRAFT_141422 [Chlorella variabilis]EFN51066.1 hypothetical protein CHLNCDRAFT_141422 [Chlorella variabilis]|eukprot:XP_005843168.1 hypothetical protein CHLNCDRAFT_141422 [Chlorella variabilis]
MDTLAAAAVAASPDAATGDKAGAGGGPDWAFPVFVGCRRPLPPDDILFEAGNIEREQLAREAAVSVARDERRQLAREAELAGDAELADRVHVTFECGRCHAALPTARLLDIHVSEMHDSFFAAQAARRMPVYLCLVEGCARKFCTVEERKQHLTEHHKFPRNYNFDRIHLRRHKAQIRPLPQYRKGHGRQAMAADAEPGAAGAPPPSDRQAAAVEGQHAEEVVQGLSRLSMAAETGTVPSVVHFGRGRGRGLAGIPRGRGGQKAPQAQPGGDT